MQDTMLMERNLICRSNSFFVVGDPYYRFFHKTPIIEASPNTSGSVIAKSMVVSVNIQVILVQRNSCEWSGFLYF